MIELIERIAKDFGLNPILVSAIIDVESAGNVYSCRFEPGYPFLYEPQEMGELSKTSFATECVLQRCSFGLMQVMGSTARELGLRAPLPTLFEPEVGIEYGCRYLRKQMTRYGDRMQAAIAAYNAGAAIERGDGQYRNGEYVSKVLFKMRSLNAAVRAHDTDAKPSVDLTDDSDSRAAFRSPGLAPLGAQGRDTGS
jgi:hypothetical protein